MRSNKHLVSILLMMIVIAALYRIIPGRQPGFAPQWAMALFAGAVIKDKKWAFAFPILSMLISDLLYQVLYTCGLSDIPGFYSGQFTNYVLFAGLTAIGFFMRKVNVPNVLLFSAIVCMAYFVVSNFLVWNGGGGCFRPHTFSGLMLTVVDGLTFMQWSFISTLVFGGVLFGAWKLMMRQNVATA